MVLNYLKRVFSFGCSHVSVKNQNCRFCPDCGKKITSRWNVIRCKACGHYRKPFIDRMGRIKPMKKYCFHCGSKEWISQNYYEATIPDGIKQISLKTVETEKHVKPEFGDLTNKTVVWIGNTSENNRQNIFRQK